MDARGIPIPIGHMRMRMRMYAYAGQGPGAGTGTGTGMLTLTGYKIDRYKIYRVHTLQTGSTGQGTQLGK